MGKVFCKGASYLVREGRRVCFCFDDLTEGSLEESYCGQRWGG